MQSNEQKLKDTRSFVEICNGLDNYLLSALRTNMVNDLNITDRTARNWIEGRNKPIGYSQRRDLVRTIKRSVGIESTPETLFI